jgi:hypothetical protein
MKDRPILFNAPMVRAILSGQKTQTRRAAKLTDAGHVKESRGYRRWHPADPDAIKACPFGQPGDRLWVRENFSGPHYQNKYPPSQWVDIDPIWYWADGNPENGDWTIPKPSIHMPRLASRITLEITGVRVERLRDISHDDAKAEGIAELEASYGNLRNERLSVPQHIFANLWESINGAGSWEANPWVWVVEFKQIQPLPGIDAAQSAI